MKIVFRWVQVQQWQRTAIQSLTKFSTTSTKLQAADACDSAALDFAKAFGIDTTTGQPTSSDACVLKIESVFDFGGNNPPTQATIGSWCKDCAVPIKAALAKLRSVRIRSSLIRQSTCHFALLHDREIPRPKHSTSLMTPRVVTYRRLYYQACTEGQIDEHIGSETLDHMQLVLDLPCLRVNGTVKLTLLLQTQPVSTPVSTWL